MINHKKNGVAFIGSVNVSTGKFNQGAVAMRLLILIIVYLSSIFIDTVKAFLASLAIVRYPQIYFC